MTTIPHRITAESILGGNIQDLIDAAKPEPTPEELAATAAERQAQELEARRIRVLSPECGWPSKSLHDVQTIPLRGERWWQAFEDAFNSIRVGGIVILFGDRGPGKTRMAAEIAVAMGAGVYRKAMGIFLDIRATYNSRSQLTERDIVEDLAAARFLVIDEIQVRGGKPFEDNLLTHLIDERYASNLPTLMIANLTHEQLADALGASIVDRVEERGEIIHCNWPSFRGQNA